VNAPAVQTHSTFDASEAAAACRAPVLRLSAVAKRYRMYRSDLDRLLEIVTGRPRHQDVTALSGIDLTVGHGEVLGIVGRNGAGKSTLLKLIAGMLPPSEGSIDIHGRVGAILELGAAFHPQMSGRENVYLKAAIAGLTRAEIDALVPEIAAFADIGPFIERPVKTYSSGMSARLAFAVATAVDPDVLIIDEALSVGDGAFARKSFDRIMAFRDAGKTILFCSHSLYHVEAICNRAVWIDQGRIRREGSPAAVLADYRAELERADTASAQEPTGVTVDTRQTPARILSVVLSADGDEGRSLRLRAGRSNLSVRVRFRIDPTLPPPSVGVAFLTADQRPFAGATSARDGVLMESDSQGEGEAEVMFPALPLLKGHYGIAVYLLCERGLHVYEQATILDALQVEDSAAERGIGLVSLPRQWRLCAGAGSPGETPTAYAEPDAVASSPTSAR